jgi:ankyrin repeat protein
MSDSLGLGRKVCRIQIYTMAKKRETKKRRTKKRRTKKMKKGGSGENKKIDVIENLILSCCEKGDLPNLKKWVLKLKEIKNVNPLDFQDEYWDSPIRICCNNSHTELLEYLIDEGANVEMGDQFGWTQLCTELFKNADMECASILLNRGGADINTVNHVGGTVLYICAQENFTIGMRFALENGADANKTTTELTPLFVATVKDNYQCVSILLAHGANANTSKNDGTSPLYIAAQLNNHRSMALLLAHGVDVNKCRNKVLTPLYVAVEKNSLECLSMLLAYEGIDADRDNGTGFTPLHNAIARNHIECMAMLLEHGVDAERKDIKGIAPIHIAANKPSLSILLAHGVDANIADYEGGTPLHYAAVTNSLECARLLIFYEHAYEPRTDVNATDNEGRTPLRLASDKGHLSMVKLLLQNGAKV